MEKGLKIVRTIAISLIAILITVIAFGGIYFQEQGIWENLLPEYNLGMEVEGFRELRYALDDTEESKKVYVDSEGNYKGDVLTSSTTNNTEGTSNVAEVEKQYKQETRTEKVNPDEIRNIETFNAAKAVIQKRLDTINQNEYNIRIDSVTGEMVVEVPEDENVELVKSLVAYKGILTVEDMDTGVILFDDNKIAKTTILTHNHTNETTGAPEYQLYMQFTLDEEGREIFREISKDYIATVSADGTQKQKCVVVKFDGQQLSVPLYFDQERTDGQLQIPLGEASENNTEIMLAAESAARVAELIDGEKMPLVYELKSDNFIKSEITDQYKIIAGIVLLVVVLIISLYMIIKYKLNGLKQAIVAIGYIGILILVIRYTQVAITFNSLIAFVAVLTINYAFSIKMLNKLKNGDSRKIALLKSMKELYLAIIPICIIAVIFTFMSGIVTNSIGTMLFWGLLVQALTSLIVLL